MGNRGIFVFLGLFRLRVIQTIYDFWLLLLCCMAMDMVWGYGYRAGSSYQVVDM